MMKSVRFLLPLALLAAMVILPYQGASAQDASAFIKYRQKVMGSNGANMGSIGDILKNGLPFTGNIAEHARNINTSAKMILAAFKKRITAGATDSKAKIWEDWSGFEEAAKNLIAQSAKLAKVAEGGDMKATMAQVKKTGGACGKCHKTYRKPKKESYKMKG